MLNTLINFISDYYLWIKACHLISVIAWMAGLFYIPRLFVYHVESEHSETKQTLDVMARKLYHIIIMPAMHASLLLGSLLFFIPGMLKNHWLHLKLSCVLGLIVFQIVINRYRQQLVLGTCQKKSQFFRLINEIPTILLIIIVICAIVKPF